MKRTIFAGVVILTAGLSGLMAQEPAKTPAPGPTTKSKAEGEAVNAVIKAGPDPDATIKAAEELMNKFADTEYKEFALSMEARAYQTKRDDVNAQIFGERVLQINPKNYMMELLVAEVIENNIKDHDLDRNDKVAKVTKLLNGSIEDLKVAPKPNPQMSDADWASGQKFTIAQAHNDMGLLALNLKHWDDAIKEFQLAVDGDPEQDAYSTRLAVADLNAGKTAECIAVCDKLLAKPNLHPQIKSFVTNIKSQAVAKK